MRQLLLGAVFGLVSSLGVVATVACIEQRRPVVGDWEDTILDHVMCRYIHSGGTTWLQCAIPGQRRPLP